MSPPRILHPDHRDHRGVFLAWHTMEFRRPTTNLSRYGPFCPTHGYDVQRGDFWGCGQFAPTDGRLIVNRDARLERADAASAEVQIHDDWMVHNQKVLDEATTAGLRDEANARILDLTYRLTSDWEVTIPQTSFSGFCFRCRNDGESYFQIRKAR